MQVEKEIVLPQSLIGKVVRINKGGPESRRGKLLAVQSDYLVLQTGSDGNDDGKEKSQKNSGKKSESKENSKENSQENFDGYQIVYYKIHHIKSLVEDSTDITGLTLASDEKTFDFIEASDFNQLLENLISRWIRIDRGGPESRCGWLLDVKPDHLVLQTEEEGVLYYTVHHIKSVSWETPVRSNRSGSRFHAENSLTYIDADDFRDLLEGMKYYWVKINRGGPESIQGILVDGGDDHLMLVANKEVHRISTFHIRNISIDGQSKSYGSSGSNGSAQDADAKSVDRQKEKKYTRKKDHAKKSGDFKKSGDLKKGGKKKGKKK